ncbi:hypothetical protein [Caballeronia calidae]|uniref:hypothetical protein n=1 Tax=Caballeronia calidae TaxID=1777139 RepID=UPI004041EBBB
MDGIDGDTGAEVTGTNAGKVLALQGLLTVRAAMSIETPSIPQGPILGNRAGSAAYIARPSAQLVGVDVVFHGGTRDRHTRLQAQCDQTPYSILVNLAPAVPFLANDEPAAKVLILVHCGLNLCVHADT